MDGEDDDTNGVMTFEVPEDDLVAGPPPPPPDEELEVRPSRAAGGVTARAEPKSGVDILRRQLERTNPKSPRDDKLVESLQGANQRAQEELTRTRQENATLRVQTVETRRQVIDSTIQTLDAALEEAESNYARAFESGVGVDVAKAQRRLSELTARKAAAENEKSTLPTAEQVKQQATEAIQPRTQEERVDEYISRFNPASQTWLRSHPDFITDRSKNRLLLNAHDLALKAEIEPESDDYFDFINKKLKLDADDVGGQQPQRRQINGNGQETQPMKRASTPVRASAPVRGGNGISTRTMRSVKLTEGEMRQATDGTLAWDRDDPKGRFKSGDPIGVNEMARRKALIQSGKTSLRYMTNDEA